MGGGRGGGGGGRVIIHHMEGVVGDAFDLTRKNEIEAEIATKIGLKLACANGVYMSQGRKPPV